MYVERYSACGPMSIHFIVKEIVLFRTTDAELPTWAIKSLISLHNRKKIIQKADDIKFLHS
jgi:hypothetical protein